MEPARSCSLSLGGVEVARDGGAVISFAQPRATVDVVLDALGFAKCPTAACAETVLAVAPRGGLFQGVPGARHRARNNGALRHVPVQGDPARRPSFNLNNPSVVLYLRRHDGPKT